MMMSGVTVTVTIAVAVAVAISAEYSLAAEAPAALEVQQESAFVYERPDPLSAIFRCLYFGEVVTPVEVVTLASGQTWVKIKLGSTRFGFVPSKALSPTEALPTSEWRPEVVVRDEHPLAVGLKALGQTYGTALELRYLPFTRLGAAFSVGAVLDRGRMQGTALSMGVNTFVMLWNLSPLAEAGVTRLSYHNKLSTLRITAFYLSVGVEWMFDNGLFLNVSGTYLRSMDIEISHEYEDARSGTISVDNYGVLDVRDANSFQGLQPGVTLGYAF